MHAYACTYVYTHALGTRRKILGAIRISAHEQNSGSNAISPSQFGDAISFLQKAMQFWHSRISATVRNSGSNSIEVFQRRRCSFTVPEAIAVSSFQKDDAIFNSMESSWEAKARNACRG